MIYEKYIIQGLIDKDPQKTELKQLHVQISNDI
jgi:hypothetical protein